MLESGILCSPNPHKKSVDACRMIARLTYGHIPWSVHIGRRMMQARNLCVKSGRSKLSIWDFMRHLSKELGELKELGEPESLGRMQDIVQRRVRPREAKISDSVKLSA